MTATIIESEQDTDIALNVWQKPDEAIPCDREGCEVEAEYETSLHCCEKPLRFCEEHLFWLYDGYKTMMNIPGMTRYFICVLCRAPHGSLKCFRATPLKS